jgi:hypothetical protein
MSTAGGRDGRRNDPRSSAPLSDRIVRANNVFAVLRRSALPQLSAQLAQPQQCAAFWQKQKAGLRSRTRAEISAEKNETKPLLSHSDHHFIFPAGAPYSNDCTVWVSRAMPQSANSTVTKNLPVIDDHNSYAALQAASSFFARSDGPPDHDEAAM